MLNVPNFHIHQLQRQEDIYVGMLKTINKSDIQMTYFQYPGSVFYLDISIPSLHKIT